MNRRVTSTALLLVLISAILHAGWNLLGKHAYPSTAFFLVANALGSLCLMPGLFLYGHVLPLFPKPVWLLVSLTGFFQAVYFWALAAAYRAGDMSIAYPLARSSPVIIVTIATVLLGRSDRLSAQSILGIFLVVGGSLILPMRRFNDFRLRNYSNLSCLFALGAAFATTGYSLIDDAALRQARAAVSIGATAVTLVYAFFEGFATSLWMALLLFAEKDRPSLGRVIRQNPYQAALTGIGMYLTYTLVLLSMAFVSDISYVVAFRQLSIPVGVILGVAVLKEPSYLPKFAGVFIMFAGLVLVGTG